MVLIWVICKWVVAWGIGAGLGLYTLNRGVEGGLERSLNDSPAGVMLITAFWFLWLIPVVTFYVLQKATLNGPAATRSTIQWLRKKAAKLAYRWRTRHAKNAYIQTAEDRI